MPSRKPRRTREEKNPPRPLLAALAVLATMFALAWLWEFVLEEPALTTFGLTYYAQFEETHRWHFILIATGFAGLSLIFPAILLTRTIRALDAARRQAESANETKTRFLANMSHELRTPLNAIIGFAQIIRDAPYGPGDVRYREYAADIHNSGRQLLAIVDDVLDFAKAEEGTLEMDTRELDLAAALLDIAESVRSLAEERHLEFRTVIDPDVPPVRADEARLKQALFNLLSNCIKFTPPRGSIVLAARVEADAVVVTVTDTGIGIAPEDLPKVLSPFSQADSSLARKFGGAGLGVPIARQLVEGMGGRLTLESAVDEGTTVTLELARA